MQKEIGGYIEFERYNGKQYHENALKLNCARNCLVYLIRACRIKKIYLPYFLCESVRNVCKRHGVEVEFYHISEDFLPILPDADFEKDWLYIVNYYGQISNQQICDIALYSCRKFFGVADGAYLYADCATHEGLDYDSSYMRMEYLLGRFERTASEFYPLFAENDRLFEREGVKRMSPLTENLMRSFDYEHIAEKRAENFRALHERLKGINKLDLQIPYGAYAYPLLVENCAEIRERLRQKKIYVPTLWADVLEVCGEGDLECGYARNILPLPVDQRYGEEEMRFLSDTVLEMM